MNLTTFPIATRPLSAEPTALPARTAKFFGRKSDGTPQFYDLSAVTNSYDLRHFDVVANGTKDDTAALVAAFAAIPAGSVIDFPQGGTVLMTSYVALPADNITIRGNGCKIISNASGQDQKFIVSGRTGIKFQGLRFDGGGLTTLNTTGIAWDTYSPRLNPGTIHFVDSTQCEVTDCNFVGLNWPVTLYGACENIRIESNTFGGYFAAVYGYFSSSDGVPNKGQPSPRRIYVNNNHFDAGKYPTWPNDPAGSPRTYTIGDQPCSGAIKFRLTPFSAFYNTAHYVVTGNTIRNPGVMGIELQGGVDDSVVANNNVTGAGIAISISYSQRVSITGNILTNFGYAGIETDGNNNPPTTDEGNNGITITGNVFDGRDDQGRPVNFYNNFGIVVTNRQKNVTITGNSFFYLKTAVGAFSVLPGYYADNILISGCRIVTNEESGYGDSLGGSDSVQGILLSGVNHVTVANCTFNPSGTAWQRMVNIINCTTVNIRGCTIVSNNAPVSIKASSDVTIESSRLEIGANPYGSGAQPSFVYVDSTQGNCQNIGVRNNIFVGSSTSGINLYAPANTISNVLVSGNDTTGASVSDPLFIARSGSIGRVAVSSNTGPGDASLNKNIGPLVIVDGNAGAFTDRPEFEQLLCLWTATVNLQSARSQASKKKIIVCLSNLSTVTIHPVSGETINGVAGDVVLSNQWERVTLESDGTNWIAVEVTPSIRFPLNDVAVSKSIKVDGGANGTKIKQITTQRFTVNFGTISAGAEFSTSLSVPCASGSTNRPSANLSWIGYIPAPVYCRQCYVESADSVNIRVYNPSTSAVLVGSQTFSVTVIEFAK